MRTARLGNLTRLVDPIVMPDGGTFKNWDDLPRWLGTDLPIILFGAALPEKRDGNDASTPTDVLHVVVRDGVKTSYNRLGLPEAYGLAWYQEHLSEKVAEIHAAGKYFAFNIAGFTVQEFEAMARVACISRVDIIVIDISCSNTTQEPFCFDPNLSRQTIEAVQNTAPETNVIVKLPYIPLPSILQELVGICVEERHVAAIDVINAMAGCLPFDPNGNRIMGGYASGGGNVALVFGMGMVSRLADLIPADSDTVIMGTGGIGCGPARSGADVLEYRQRGASVVGVHTAARSPVPPHGIDYGTFDRIKADYLALTKQEVASA